MGNEKHPSLKQIKMSKKSSKKSSSKKSSKKSSKSTKSTKASTKSSRPSTHFLSSGKPLTMKEFQEELRGHPQGGYLRSPAPQAHDGRLRRLPPAAVWRLRQRRWLRLDCGSPGQLRLPVRLLCPGPHALLCPHALRHLRRPQLRHLRHPLLRWSTLRKLYLCARKLQRSEIFSRVRERVG